MNDEQAEDRGENGAAPEPEPEVDLDEVEPELLATFTEIGIVETRRAIEAILLVATDPTPASLLAQLLEVQVEHVELLCHALADSYEEANHGFQLVKVAGGWRFQTHPDMAPYVERFAMDGQSSKLSNAALETLAIVAYKQPISRAQVSAIRGVNVDAVLRTLVQRGYVDEVGRDTGAGQAVLFGTTSMFLERLGINTVADLPALGDFVPSAEVVEALEQTLKVDLDPDLVTTDRDGDDDGGLAARAPTPSPDPTDEADPDADADAAADADAGGGSAAEAGAEADDQAGADVGEGAVSGDEPGAEDAIEPEVEAEDAIEAEAGDDIVAEDVAPEPGGPVEAVVVEQESDLRHEIDRPADDARGAVVAKVEKAEPARGAGAERASHAAQPVNERVAEQVGEPATASPAPVAAPEGVVVDAQASSKSGADRTDVPLGPDGEPTGRQAGGGQPGLADASSAPMAGPGTGGALAVGGPDADLPGAPEPDAGPGATQAVADGPSGLVDGPHGGPRADEPVDRRHLDGSARTGPDDGRSDPAAGRVDHEIPAGDGQVLDVRRPADTPAPTPAAGGRPSPQPDPAPAGLHRSVVEGGQLDGRSEPFDHRPERHSGPAAGHAAPDRPAGGDDATASTGPGGPGLAGPADPAVPPAAGPGPDLTATEPVVDLRPPLDLTEPPRPPSAPSPSGTGGPDADRA